MELLTADDEELALADENNDLDQDEAHAAVECARGDLNPVGGSLQSQINEEIRAELLATSDDDEDDLVAMCDDDDE